MAEGHTCKIIYKFSSTLIEDHKQEIYDCKFNSASQSEGHYVFATVGSNRASIYDYSKQSKITLLQLYQDPAEDEVYYCCCWTQDLHTSSPLLIIGGLSGVIRIINTTLSKCVQHFTGHGGAINDMKICPKSTELLLSASMDHSIRLWNLDSCACIAVFGPYSGHRDQVLCIDIHLSGNRFISGGMDHAIKIWSLEDEAIKRSVNKSRTISKHPKKSLKPFEENIPVFTTREVHTNYVDCIRWYGDLVISKSCQSEIVIWKPGEIELSDDSNDSSEEIPRLTQKKDIVTILRRFVYNDGFLWYTRFGVDEAVNIIAVGNENGKIYIWDISVENPMQTQKAILEHPKCKGTIRQITITNDGNTLVCVCSDSSIWRWDKVDVSPKNGVILIKNKKTLTLISSKQVVHAE